MKKYKLAVIGGGNMAEAILSRALNAGVLEKEDVTVIDIKEERLVYLSTTYGIHTTDAGQESIKASDMVLLAIKPQTCTKVLQTYASDLASKALISIVTGYTYADFKKCLSENTRLLCVMPNTPAMVGEGMSVLYAEHSFSEDELNFSKNLFSALGEIEVLSERYADAVIGVSGSSPAYVQLFIEAMADGGVYKGLPRNIAYKMASQAVLGAAKLYKSSGMHPGQLKDNVCSPGGTTIEAIRSLEMNGFRSAVMEAVIAASDKATKLK